jgi:hypothetical protein
MIQLRCGYEDRFLTKLCLAVPILDQTNNIRQQKLPMYSDKYSINSWVSHHIRRETNAWFESIIDLVARLGLPQ